MGFIDDLKKGPSKARPTTTLRLCFDLDLVADIKRLEDEKNDLLIEHARTSDTGERAPRRQGEPSEPERITEIDAALEDLYDQMRSSEGELILRATDGGRWVRWKDEHPPREDNQLDAQITYGVCNAADLLDDIGTYLVSLEGEPLTAADWSWLQEKVAPADLPEITKAVISLHEVRLTAPKASTKTSGSASA